MEVMYPVGADKVSVVAVWGNSDIYMDPDNIQFPVSRRQLSISLRKDH